MMNPETILTFWFEDLSDDKKFDAQSWTVRKWFSSNPKFDLELKENFESHLLKAQAGAYKSWEESPTGILALILMFDQFPRNIYRGTSQAYSFDSLASNCARKLIATELDKSLSLIQRVFVYMPFMHAPVLDVQNESIVLFSDLLDAAKEKTSPNLKYFEKTLRYAHEHREIIEKFGCFPNRAKINV